MTEIAERRGLEYGKVDFIASQDLVWALPANIAMRFAEDVQEGGCGLYLWQPVMVNA